MSKGFPTIDDQLSLFRLRTEVVYGDGCSGKMGSYLTFHDSQRPLVVSDPGVVDAGVLDPLMKSLSLRGISPTIYAGVKADPDVRVAELGLQRRGSSINLTANCCIANFCVHCISKIYRCRSSW